MDIGIIKIGAKGDVVRTLPIIKGIKEKFASSKITLITGNSIDLLRNQPFIDRIEKIPYSAEKKFDILYNFDIDVQATTLVEKITATEKKGFYSEDGFLQAFNIGAQYYLNTLYDDGLKKSNEKTYQEMMFEAAEIKSTKERSQIILEDRDKKYATEFFNKLQIPLKKTIGLHMGSSNRWPSKVWHEKELMQFIKRANEKKYGVVLFGGPIEIETQKRVISSLKKEGVIVASNDPKNTDREFASLVNKCDVMICSDSFSLHIALSLGKKTVGLFFCTSPAEVEGYGLLTKIVSPKLDEFFPQKMDQYDESLTRSITHQEVFSVVEKILNANE